MIALKRQRTAPIGLCLNPESVSVLQLAGESGRWKVHAMASSPLSLDESASADEQDRGRAAALRRLIADHHFKGRQVISCLGAEELFVQNVRLPQLPPEEVAKVVAWEAEERLPYPVSEAEIRHLVAGQIRQETNVKQEVILLACHQGVIKRHISMLEQAGLTPLALDIEPCAVLRSLHAADGAPSGRRAYLNLGERATTVIFAEGDQILFLKYIAGGGHQLDQAVARHLDLNLDEAVRMRATVTAADHLDSEDDVHCSVIDAVRNTLESMGSEIELCLRYYKVTFRRAPIERIVVTGNEASQWLADFLEQRLGTPCELGNPYGLLEHPPTSAGRPWRWSTALGLSMKPCASVAG